MDALTTQSTMLAGVLTAAGALPDHDPFGSNRSERTRRDRIKGLEHVLVARVVSIFAEHAPGGALAHWRRGTGFFATGAVIGGVATFILATVGALYSSTILAVALIAFVGLLVLSLASMFT